MAVFVGYYFLPEKAQILDSADFLLVKILKVERNGITYSQDPTVIDRPLKFLHEGNGIIFLEDSAPGGEPVKVIYRT